MMQRSLFLLIEKIFLLKKFAINKTSSIFALTNAEVAQLVELQPSKLVVASSSLVFRSAKPQIYV